MEPKETEARLITLTKITWQKLDAIAEKYGYMNAQEVIRQAVAATLKGEEKE